MKVMGWSLGNVLGIMAIAVTALALSVAQTIPGRRQVPEASGAAQPENESSRGQGQALDPQSEDELRKGTALTRQGEFGQAIPHLLAAKGRVVNEYAAAFNLALCYVGSGAFQKAVPLLMDLRRTHENADVENLLAQAYVGTVRQQEALAALERAAAITPKNEKLYLFVADACVEHQEYALALKVIALGLRNLPDSPRLHYEHGILLSDLDQFDRSKRDFERVSELAGNTEIGYIAAAEKNLLQGNVPGAAQAAREGIAKGFRDPVLLTILGEAVLRSGAGPDEPEFEDARSALEKAVAARPNDPSSRIVLGRLYLRAGRSADAIVQLEKAKQMQPDRPVIYANLAKAYQHHGDEQAAQQALAALEKLNMARAEQIRSAPGERKMSYGGGEVVDEAPPSAPQKRRP